MRTESSVERWKLRFLTWWQAPVTRGDRLLGAVVGALGGFWVGVIGRLAIGPAPASLEALAGWAIGLAAAGVVLGLRYPKAVSCVCFPFAVFGASS